MADHGLQEQGDPGCDQSSLADRARHLIEHHCVNQLEQADSDQQSNGQLGAGMYSEGLTFTADFSSQQHLLHCCWSGEGITVDMCVS
jgi:hypothetical protein